MDGDSLAYIVFGLLRSSLFDEPYRLERSLGTDEWSDVFDFCCRQKVSALVAQGIELQPEERRPDPRMMRRFMVEKDRVSHHSQYLQKTFLQLLQFFNHNGFRTMLLKGALTSSYYPKPNLREYGDIDIYQFGQYRQADEAVAQKFGVKVSNDAHHHTKYVFEGVTVESHYDFVNTHTPRSNKAYEQLLKSYDASAYKIHFRGEDLWLPSATFQALFLVRHMVGHFASGQITVRDLCDWSMFLYRRGEEVDWVKVSEVYRQYNMHHFVGALQGVLEDYLGLPSIPMLPRDKDKVLMKRVFNDILYGEFGESVHEQEDLSRLWWKLRRHHSNRWKHQIIYSDSYLGTLADSIASHIAKPRSILHKM